MAKRATFKDNPKHHYRRDHWIERDKETELRFFVQGHNVERIMREMNLCRSSVQESLSRVKKKRGVDSRIKSKSLVEKVNEFKEWLFDTSNTLEDPCLKWLEVFGDS